MANFNKRLSAPSQSDSHYFSGDNIFYACGYGMPNCTAYAWGRLYEITGNRYVGLHGNAEEWWAAAQNTGMQTGQTPKLGAIICWRAGSASNSADGAGHVAVVEEIHTNGDIVTSNSAWKGTNFYVQTLTKASGYLYSSSRPLLGFIYCGIDFDGNPQEEVQESNNSNESSCDYVRGDVVKLNSNAKWATNSTPASWVYNSELTVKEVRGDILVLSTQGVDGGVTGTAYANNVYHIGEAPEEPAPAPSVSKRDSLNKGDIVHFIGNTHYTSSYQNGVGKNASPCEAEVTAINNSSSSSVVRRYHLVGDGVYGWVDSSDIEELS